MRRKGFLVAIIIGVILILGIGFIWWNSTRNKETILEVSVNLNKLETYKTYEQSDFATFLEDYQNNRLDVIYITKFLFDGVSMYKPLDLDDFIESQNNNLEVSPLEITVINIAKPGIITLTGQINNAMIAINTNNQSKDYVIELNDVSIDTNSKNVPAMYVYNKDRTYDKTKVTIKTLENTKNYLNGGKLKKISLIPKEEMDVYAQNYSYDYEDYPNYYGVYTKEELNNILFAQVEANQEDLREQDPYFYYKASGAISSDIDLTFVGKGYLEVNSKNKEGIETKGNMSFLGSTGDYVINAYDDCLNTTTDNKELNNARNDLIIDVNSMTAIVAKEATEGDAIDSNGKIAINAGTVLAIAHPGQDAGLDSESGIDINGGTILATGDMYDRINSASKQNFMVLSFTNPTSETESLTLLDSNNTPILSYTTDRKFQTLVFSSPKLTNGSYKLYQDGKIFGTKKYGFYQIINSYQKGTPLSYISTSIPGMEKNEIPIPGQGKNEPPQEIKGNDNNNPNYDFVIDKIENLFGEVGVYTYNS